MPWITGYLAAGLLFGPSLLGFASKDVVEDLGFLNSLALAFIAFSAGGELRLKNIRDRLKPILFLVGGVTVMVFVGVTSTIFFISSLLPFSSGFGPVTRFVLAAIFGVIAVARSPSSTIAIICETKSKGVYTDTVLSVTVITDVLIIVLFAVVVSIAEIVLLSGGGIGFGFLLILLLEIGIAILLGFFLGKAIVFLIRRVKVEFPVVVAAMGFLVIKFSHFLGEYLKEAHELSLNIEPLLICMAAGFTVQNFSRHGNKFLEEMEGVSLPIYISFFAITGAVMDLEIVKAAWFLGLVMVVSRTAMIFWGSQLSGRLAGDDPIIYRNTWLGFITQAGVSLGLLTEVVRRFPEFGLAAQSILISAITINQIFGPIAFKIGLKKVGDINRKEC
jgi:Kef-type K+ transport system membrane component KefB